MSDPEDAAALRAELDALRTLVESHPATASEANKLRGWKGIADALHASEDAVQRWAARDRDPLPIAHDHLGVVITRSALDRWRWEQLVPYRVHLERTRTRRERRRAASKRKRA